MPCTKWATYISKKVLSARNPNEARNSAIFLHDHYALGVVPPKGETGQVLTKCSDSDYQYSWEDAGALIPSLTELVVENTLFVMGNGNDGTGTRERFDLPYATIITAMANAQVGDTVIVYPGQYTENGSDPAARILTQGRSLYLHNNALVGILEPNTNIIEVADWNLYAGASHGIYGNGKLGFLSAADSFLTIGGPATESFLTIECDVLELSNVALSLREMYNFTLNVNELISTNTCGIQVEPLTNDNSLFNFNIKKFNCNSIVGIFIGSTRQNNININIDIFTTTVFALCNILFQNNPATSRIVLNINNYYDASNIQSDAPIILNDMCMSHKDVRIKNIKSSHILYEPASFTASAFETGTYEFTGVLAFTEPLKTDNTLLADGSTTYSIIDFRNYYQNVTFKLNIQVDIDDTDFISYDPIILNITKEISLLNNECNQKVTGRLHVTGVTIPTNNSLVQYGLMLNSIGVATRTPVLRDFVITNELPVSIVPCLGKNTLLTIAEVPIMSVYSNCVIAIAPSIPIQVIDTIVSNVNVK